MAGSTFGGAIVGAVVATIATGLVARGTGFISFTGDAAINQAVDTILGRLEVRLVKGGDAGSKDSKMANFYASCEDNELIIGGTCIAESLGYLQNQGIVLDGPEPKENPTLAAKGRVIGKAYACTYSSRTDLKEIKATAFAACLTRRP